MKKVIDLEEKRIKTVACYCRVSHEEQVIKNLSIPAQQKELDAYCRENNYRIYDYYIDEGLTATNMKRPGLLRLLSDLDKFDLVLFTRQDRFSRNILDANLIDQKLKKYNVGMIAINEDDIDTVTADGRFMFNLKLNLAQREAEKTSERIKDVFKYKIQNNEVISGSYPPGFKIEGKHLVIDKDTVHIPKDVFNLVEECMSVRKAFFKYNDTHEQKLCKGTFTKMIKNKLYIGIYDKSNYYKENYCEPIISKEQFKRVNEIAINNRVYTKTQRNEEYIFSGILKCKNCGYKMAGVYKIKKDGSLRIYYRCCRRANFKDCSNKKTPGQKYIEDYLLEHISEEFKRYELDYYAKNHSFVKSNIKKDIEKINKKLKKLRDLYLDDLISKDDYSNEYNILNNKLNELTEKEKNTQDIKDFTKLEELLNREDLKDVYYKLDSLEKKRFWTSFIKTIYVDDNSNLEVIFL